jgi:CRISPR-associated protein Cas5d
MSTNYLSVQVTADFACFTRPEAKVERLTYPVMTPSAARGALEAIFWHPQFAWQVRRIDVLREIRYLSILRNEVNSKAVTSTDRSYFADEHRTQRNSVILRDVAYAIHAEPILKAGVTDDIAKFRDQFRRRVQRGQCFHRPALGCREFAAEFGPLAGDAPIDRTEHLGWMLFDLAYGNGKPPYTPVFFDAHLNKGVLDVPPELYEEVA